MIYRAGATGLPREAAIARLWVGGYPPLNAPNIVSIHINHINKKLLAHGERITSQWGGFARGPRGNYICAKIQPELPRKRVNRRMFAI